MIMAANKTTPTDKPRWQVLVERHKGKDVAKVLVRLCEVLLLKGHCTAEDAHNVEVSNAKAVRGVAARLLRSLEIAEKEALTYGTTKKSHRHMMFRWRLINRRRAEKLVNALEASVFHRIRSIETDTKGNFLLNV